LVSTALTTPPSRSIVSQLAWLEDTEMHAPEEIWREQCAAAATIKSRFGRTAALDYLVGEKLLAFVTAAQSRPEFARQLPAFIAGIRELFDPDDIANDLERVEQLLLERIRDETFEEDLPSSAERDLKALRQVTDLLKSSKLGTA
jgi:hypothetical protein